MEKSIQACGLLIRNEGKRRATFKASDFWECTMW